MMVSALSADASSTGDTVAVTLFCPAGMVTLPLRPV